MSDPLTTTFDLLISTENKYAIDVLVAGLDVKNESVRERCALALIKRKGTRGTVEVIRRLDSLNQRTRKHFESYASNMAAALQQCLLHGDEELKTKSLEIVRSMENFELFPAIVELLENQDNQLYELVYQTFNDMVNRVYECSHVDARPGEKSQQVHNISQVLRNMQLALDKACTKFEALLHPETILHAVLVLGDPGSFAVKRVMSQANAECKELSSHLLMTSKHPGVMQLPLDYMSQNYPHTRAFKTIEGRSDPEFICQLLRWFPKRLTENQKKNFQQIKSIAWLNSYNLSLEMVPAGLQESLIAFVSATALPVEMKQCVQEWIVRHGDPEGRLAAAEVLSSLNQNIVHDIVFDSLDSEDSDIQVWATSQLRSQKIPEAFSLLVERLDSPLDAVRNAARAELESFNVERMLSLYEHLDPAVCLQAGELIQKIDPHCLNKIQRELKSPIIRNRIRAAKAAQAMGIHSNAVPLFAEMLEEDDAMLRRTAVEVLATISSIESAAALTKVLDDPSPRVRDSAQKALDQINHQMAVAPSV